MRGSTYRISKLQSDDEWGMAFARTIPEDFLEKFRRTSRQFSHERENSSRWSESRDLSITSLSPRPIARILWVFFARVGRSKGRKRGEKREA